MIKIPETYADARYLNVEIEKHLGNHTFTEAQETAIMDLVIDIASGYRHTISRMEWGPGWD